MALWFILPIVICIKNVYLDQLKMQLRGQSTIIQTENILQAPQHAAEQDAKIYH